MNGNDAGFVFLKLFAHRALLAIVFLLEETEHMRVGDYGWVLLAWLLETAKNLDDVINDHIIVPA